MSLFIMAAKSNTRRCLLTYLGILSVFILMLVYIIKDHLFIMATRNNYAVITDGRNMTLVDEIHYYGKRKEKLGENALKIYKFTKNSTIPPIVNQQRKLILGYTAYFDPWETVLSFKGCYYSNCDLTEQRTRINESDVVLFEYKLVGDKNFPVLPSPIRQKQLWMLSMSESSGFLFNHFKNSWNGLINMTLSYRRDSTLYYNIYAPTKGYQLRQNTSLQLDYSIGKTKGAVILVSNCESAGYDRLETIQQLARFTSVDVFGDCGSPFPCNRQDMICTENFLKQYHFYLSFENSLCKDYITEKFWVRLASHSYLIPVAYGGITIEDYDKLAPPESYIHGYNFSSIKALGDYLNILTKNKQAYNRYHEWRRHYYINMKYPNQLPSCKICELANNLPNTPGIKNLSEWWNDPNQCRNQH